MKLYEICVPLENAIERALDMAQETGGLITEEMSMLLDGLQMAKEQKALEIGRAIKNLRAEAAQVEEEEKKLRARRKSTEAYADWLKSILQTQLSGTEKYKDANTQIGWRESEHVVVKDLAALEKSHQDCIKIEITPKLTEINKKIKAGIITSDIAVIEKSNNIQIR